LLPGEASGLISEQLESIIHSAHSELDLGLLIGFAISLWSARSSTVALMIGLDFAYKEEETRGFLWFQAIAVALTIGAILFGIAALALIALLPMGTLHEGSDRSRRSSFYSRRPRSNSCLITSAPSEKR